MADIFISYASDDRSRVELLAKALENLGWSVWWDRRITVGQSFEEVIEQALDEANCVIAVWSVKSISSKWVRAEAAEGDRRQILAPVLLEEVKPPLFYRQFQTASLVGWDGSKSYSGFRQLIQALTSILDSPEPKKAKELIEPAETIKNEIGIEFVLIPAGSFKMGSKLSVKKSLQKYGGSQDWYESEHPQHNVTISKEFYLQSTAVTQGQWEKVMENNPSDFKDCGADCPVERVSWEGAHKFIKKLNKIEKTDKYRLPTETEWEYACRAGTNTEFSFGDDASELSEYAWYDDNSEKRTHPVGKKKPNSWGFYDMHGNVWEWVEDDWHDTYYGAPSDCFAWIDEPRGAYRVIRGGGWYSLARFCRAAIRLYTPDDRYGGVGFRLARSVALGP